MPYRTPDDPRKQRRLPMLDRLTVKTPCHAAWDAMVGDDRVRHCCQCNRAVYDLTAMDADEAEAFLDEHLSTTGALPCARLFRRPDRRVMTSQCPTAADRRHRMRVAGAISAVATAAAAALSANFPVLGPDDPVVVEDREPLARAHDVEPVRQVMGAVVLEGDDDDDVQEWKPPPPSPELAPVSVTLRAAKPPLLWSSSSR
jgi:hypothetical protein